MNQQPPTVLRLRNLFFCLFLLVTAFPEPLLAQDATESSRWQAWQFLIGEWTGEGGGEPGQGTGTFTFSADLQGRVLVRRNHADYPPAEARPAYSHDDLMVIYREEGKPTRASYFDNEGHVIQYSAEFSGDSSSVVFLSDPSPDAPRFRLTYGKKSEGVVTIHFEYAPGGKPETFVPLIEAVARRK